ncbi:MULTISPECIES: PKD domain-containing protein [Bacteroides]|uniref:PKD domain-containing protein n=1 Tax=Bacteroides TaxID=816 RepID=UPI0006723585|nr:MULTISPECIES: PKD domain-containing protein [Bacteroides]MCM0204854.1 PKD domain-containing protein [Bacteroides fragilis]MCM0362556.1 PKD domain-containing protein [Bacteroides fragilis]MCY6331296.1 PKD domain-containing protein [Bacteroides fragilis]MDA1489484.1 PKD domain-containing protein [Bacteroides fragilis]QCQ54863.1 PKD domain-containing protein [Bacteroides fragilis]
MMNKFINTKIFYILISVAVLFMVFLLVLRGCSQGPEIQATVSPSDPVVGQEIFYSDSTSGAETWYWEFGDNGTSNQRSGHHLFKQEGVYKIRLTVNGNLERYFDVRVKEETGTENQHLVHIIAPKEAIQGENIIFRGEGHDEQWRWEFGETGMIDSREKTALYAYAEPGEYEVLLSTENTRYPIRHRINILPYYSENDSTDVMVLIGLDIKEKLQNIVDGKPFNINYNYVVSKYFNNNPNTLVVVNNNKYNDFYSYCQGLHHIGKKETVIQNVIVESEGEENGQISRIAVIQTDKKR